MYTPDKKYNLHELLKKADGGDLEAMETAVMFIIAEGYKEHDPDGEIAERIITYLHRLAESGKPVAYIMLGDAFLKGDGVRKDVREAIRWYEKAAESGVRFGNECIGMIYYEGTDLPADYQKAYEYFTKDNAKKSFCTIYALGEMYRRGLYVSKDDSKACEYYARIVEDKWRYADTDDYYWRAFFRLGVAAHYGKGIDKDLNYAVKLLSKAKSLHKFRGENATTGDITKEEFDQEWLLLNQDAGLF